MSDPVRIGNHSHMTDPRPEHSDPADRRDGLLARARDRIHDADERCLVVESDGLGTTVVVVASHPPAASDRHAPVQQQRQR